MKEETDICHYCAKRGRKRNLAKVTWLVNGQSNDFCPHCLDDVIKSALQDPWHRKHGYKIEYPYRNE